MVSSRFIKHKTIIDAVFNPKSQFPCTELYIAGHTRVYRVDTPEPRIVRIAPGSKDHYRFQAELLEAIADKDNMTVRILHWEMREIENQICGIQIQTYLPGTPLDHYPSPAESLAIVEASYVLHQRLCAVSSMLGSKGIPNIAQTSKNLLASAVDSPMKEAGDKLLKDPRYNELITEGEECLTYCDFWPQNLLLEHTSDGVKVRIVDIDPLILGPKILQPAMLLSSYFLIMSALYAPDASHVFDLDELLGYWPESLNRQDVLLLMQVFPIMLGLHKTHQFTQDSGITPEAYQSSMGLLMRCLRIIEKLRT